MSISAVTSLVSSKEPLVVLGLGQLGSLFRDAFAAAGHTVVTLGRNDDRAALGEKYPEPGLVLVAVGEDDLEPALAELPATWKSRVVLVQNELRPGPWLAAGVNEPTVLVVWFERKQGLAPKAVRESVVQGPLSTFIATSLVPLGLLARPIDEAALVFELCLKNLYILTLNLCGLVAQGTAGQLLTEHAALFARITDEVLAIERGLFGSEQELDGAALRAGLERAIHADPTHSTAGRSAPRRLERALAHAERLGIDVPTLRDVIARRAS